jgi:hypothetical protein
MRHEFEAVVLELDTAPDLLRYLEFRAALFEQHLVSPAARELDLLATFKTRTEQAEAAKAHGHGLVVEASAWERYQRDYSQAIAKRAEENRFSYIVDEWIEWMHTVLGYRAEHADPSSAHFEALNSSNSYFEIISELARLPRLARRVIGKRVYEKSVRAISRPYSYYLQILGPDEGLLFIATSSPRDERLKLLEAMCYLAASAQELDSIIGIASEPADFPDGHSVDALMMRGVDPSLREELKEEGLRFFGPMRDGVVSEYPE